MLGPSSGVCVSGDRSRSEQRLQQCLRALCHSRLSAGGRRRHCTGYRAATMLRIALHRGCRLQVVAAPKGPSLLTRGHRTVFVQATAQPSCAAAQPAVIRLQRQKLSAASLLGSLAHVEGLRRGQTRTLSQTAQASADGEHDGGFKLIIYSRDDCSLCDGLKEKVQAILDRAQFTGSRLAAATLEVRDISSNPDWEAKYGLQIPVLANAELDDSHEQAIPRPSPRLTTNRLERHIVDVIESRSVAGRSS